MTVSVPLDIVVMGVSGTGKTTVGRALAQQLGLPFAEGDEFHSEAARQKMASGRPLTDQDRWPWLERLRAWMDQQGAQNHRGCVVACSALKRAYRDVLRGAVGDVFFCHLVVDEATLRSRIEHRPGHYMPVSLLSSQLETLESLQPDEQGIRLSAQAEPEVTVAKVLEWLDNGRRLPHQELPHARG